MSLASDVQNVGPDELISVVRAVAYALRRAKSEMAGDWAEYRDDLAAEVIRFSSRGPTESIIKELWLALKCVPAPVPATRRDSWRSSNEQ